MSYGRDAAEATEYVYVLGSWCRGLFWAVWIRRPPFPRVVHWHPPAPRDLDLAAGARRRCLTTVRCDIDRDLEANRPYALNRGRS